METGLIWNRAPALGDALDRLNIREKGWYAFDVTPFVAEQLAGDQIVSLAFLDDQERDRLVNLWSREAIRHQPVLTITYASGAPVENAPPVAEIVAFPEEGEGPLTVAFDGSASTDADGQGLTYHWDFGDGTTASDAVVQHTYKEAGTYTAGSVDRDGYRGGCGLGRHPDHGGGGNASRQCEFVTNGGFENIDASGKPYDWRLGSTGAWQVVDTEVSVGSYSLQLDGADQSLRTPIASAMTVWLEAGAYTLCATMASERLGLQDGKRRGVRVSLKDESIQQGSGNIASTATVQGTHDWHQTCQPVAIQRAGNYTVRIEAMNKPNGWAWIDTVSLRQEAVGH